MAPPRPFLSPLVAPPDHPCPLSPFAELDRAIAEDDAGSDAETQGRKPPPSLRAPVSPKGTGPRSPLSPFNAGPRSPLSPFSTGPRSPLSPYSSEGTPRPRSPLPPFIPEEEVQPSSPLSPYRAGVWLSAEAAAAARPPSMDSPTGFTTALGAGRRGARWGLSRHNSIVAYDAQVALDPLDELALSSPAEWVGKLQEGISFKVDLPQDPDGEREQGEGPGPLGQPESASGQPQQLELSQRLHAPQAGEERQPESPGGADAAGRAQRRAALRRSRPEALKRRPSMLQKNLTMPVERSTPHTDEQQHDQRPGGSTRDALQRRFNAPRTPTATSVRFDPSLTLRNTGSSRSTSTREGQPSACEEASRFQITNTSRESFGSHSSTGLKGAPVDATPEAVRARFLESSRRIKSCKERLQTVLTERWSQPNV